MKKQDLIAQLSCFDDEDDICLAFPSGDYWGRVLAKEVSEVSTEQVAWSDYHNSYKLVDEEDIEKGYYEKEDLKKVIVLS